MSPTIPAAPANITAGLCQCGCGLPAPIAKETSRRLGVMKGQPLRFVHGHRARLPQFRPRGPRPGALHRFWSQVKLVDGPMPTPCWIWTGATWPNGYGRVRLAGRTEYAHRLAYEGAVGPIPDDGQADHHCDQRGCINPEHLFPGNHTINARDAASKGRLWSKLRPGNVLEMRDLHRAGWSVSALAKKFDVASSTVTKIVATRKAWHHLTPPDWEPAPMRCSRGHLPDGARIDVLGRKYQTC